MELSLASVFLCAADGKGKKLFPAYARSVSLSFVVGAVSFSFFFILGFPAKDTTSFFLSHSAFPFVYLQQGREEKKKILPVVAVFVELGCSSAM